jgi:DNA-directed RNA polymerase specialized sigma24 family protein
MLMATPETALTEVDEGDLVARLYYEGMNHAAAAQVLYCAETTVSWRVFRAKRTLKTLLPRKEGQS